MTRARVLYGGLLLLAFAGFLISFYLTLNHYRDTVPPCYVTTGCESVVTSRYSTIAGVPVALLGTIFFAGMFYLTIAHATVRNKWVARSYDVLALAGALGALFLFLLQALILDAFCSYCVTTEVIALAMWGASLFLPGPASKPDSQPMPVPVSTEATPPGPASTDASPSGLAAFKASRPHPARGGSRRRRKA